ncbi:MAG: hemolysin family protein [Verrucomicrobiales bacterium]
MVLRVRGRALFAEGLSRGKHGGRRCASPRRAAQDPRRSRPAAAGGPAHGSVSNLGLGVLCLAVVMESAPEASLASGVALVALLGGVVLFSDVLPKAIALRQPGNVLRTLARPLVALDPLLGPVASVVERFSGTIVRAFTPRSLEARAPILNDEVETLVEMETDEGALADSEGEMIQDILKLGQKTAKDCMTPRIDAVTLSDETPPDEARREVLEHRHWKIPVYRGGNPDAIIGVLDVFEYLCGGGSDFLKFVRPPVFVPATMRAFDLFHGYLAAPHSLVIVLDEFGGFEGVVSHSDMVEEFLSDAAPALIRDDVWQESSDGNELVLSGATRLDEIEEAWHIALEEDGLDTIGGLIFTKFGKLPPEGESIQLHDHLTATVEKVERKRIAEVRLRRH